VKIGPRTTRAELGALVATALAELGDEPVLVGGAVVAIYTAGRYVSDDLDFVTWRQERQYRPLLQALGFRKRGAHWEHPDSELLLQFVNAPVMVGRKHVRAVEQLKTRAGRLHVLSPLDCVLDRFCWYLSHGDRQALAQAVDVMRAREVPLADVEAWLADEDYPERHKAAARAELERGLKRR
jgi:hypothetical protein